MDTTDEARAELTRRGVKYETVDADTYKFTRWRNGEIDAAWDDAEKWGEPHLLVIGFTPTQAVTATLGAGTLTAEQVSRATYAHSIHADCADADWQAITDELNAMLGPRTCHPVPIYSFDGEFTEYDCDACSECGAEWEGDTPNFCPNCGRRIEVDE